MSRIKISQLPDNIPVEELSESDTSQIQGGGGGVVGSGGTGGPSAMLGGGGVVGSGGTGRPSIVVDKDVAWLI
jgi:hypothetical protein